VAVGVPRRDRLLRRDPLSLDRVVASFPAGLLLAGRRGVGVVSPERLGGPQSLLPFLGSLSSSAGGGDDRRSRRGRAVVAGPLPAVGGCCPARPPARVLDSLDRPRARVWSAPLASRDLRSLLGTRPSPRGARSGRLRREHSGRTAPGRGRVEALW